MQVVLVMFRSDGERRSFSVAHDVTVIGRREDCDIRIPLGDVSRKHCRLIQEGKQLKIEDLGSSNGTFCNGQRIQESELEPGDSLQVGPVVFVVQIDGVPADNELRPLPAAGDTGAAIPVPTEAHGLSPTAQSEVGETLEVNADHDDIDARVLDDAQAGDSVHIEMREGGDKR